jgi:hypothetical protein
MNRPARCHRSTRLRTFIFSLPLPLLLALPLHGQSAPDTSSGPSFANSVATKAGVVPVGIAVLGFHELGHYSFGRLFGATDVRMGLFRRKPEGGFMIGWTDLGHTAFSPMGDVMVGFGGVIFSRGFAEGMNLLSTDVLADGTLRRLASIGFLIGRFDLPRYVLQDALINMFGHRASDIDMAVTAIAGRGTVVRTAVYGALLTLVTLDLINDWDRIEYHWDIAAGESPLRPGGAALSVRPVLSRDGVGIAASMSW